MLTIGTYQFLLRGSQFIFIDIFINILRTEHVALIEVFQNFRSKIVALQPLLEPIQTCKWSARLSFHGECLNHFHSIHQANPMHAFRVVRSKEESQSNEIVPAQTQLPFCILRQIDLHELLVVENVLVDSLGAEEKRVTVFSNNTVNQSKLYQSALF